MSYYEQIGDGRMKKKIDFRWSANESENAANAHGRGEKMSAYVALLAWYEVD